MTFFHTSSRSPSPGPPEDGADDIGALLRMLGQLTDPRHPNGVRHDLVFVLAGSVAAVLGGADSFATIAADIKDMSPQLLKKLGAHWNWFTHRYDYPRESTLRRILTEVDAAELDLLIGAWLCERARPDDDGLLVIAVDGKVLRGAWSEANAQFTLFSAMIHDVGVPVGQVAVPADTNEITQVSALLDTIELPRDRTIVTLDAAHTQRDTAEEIKGKRGLDYVMTVKGNQPTLQKNVADKCRPLLNGDPHHVVEERGHGRINRWSTWVTDAADIDFPHVKQIACIRRDVFDLDGTAVSKEFALVVTSRAAAIASPVGIHTWVRGHWGIENKVHYPRDTTWNEDRNQARTGNGPQVMAGLRNLALGIFRLNGIQEIKDAARNVCRNFDRAMPLMAI